MAIFGEIVLLCFGLFLLVLSAGNFWVAISFSGRTSYLSIVAAGCSSLILWLAIHYGPISVSFNAG